MSMWSEHLMSNDHETAFGLKARCLFDRITWEGSCARALLDEDDTQLDACHDIPGP
jgi:hypothetical protein